MSSSKALLGLLALASLAGSTTAQTIKKLIQEGDTIIGMGALTSISIPVINDAGMWVVLVDTDFPNQDQDSCLLRNGFVTLREGTTLFAPPGGDVLDDWSSFWMNNRGDLAMDLKIKVPAVPTPIVKNALYWNTVPVAFQDDVINSPLLGAGSTWLNFNTVKMNDGGEILAMGDIKNTVFTSGKQSALIRYDVDTGGNVLGLTVITTKGMLIPALGQDVTLTTLPNTDHGLFLNRHGDFMTIVSSLVPAAYMINLQTVVAQEGAPSPIPGINWKQLLNAPKVCINDVGDYVFSGVLDSATNGFLIVKNGQPLYRQGDILPLFSNLPLSNGSSAPIYVTNNGDVFWRAKSANSPTNDAFMRNDVPLVQSNVSFIEGNLVTSVQIADNAFAVSPNGRFWVGRVSVQSTPAPKDTLLYEDFGLVLKIPGCFGNPGKLGVDSGQALLGNHLEFTMDNGQQAGVVPGIIFATAPRLPNSDCGVVTQFGELLVRTSSRVTTAILPTWNGTQPSKLNVTLPTDISFVNTTIFAQGFFRGGVPHMTLTNGLRIEIGAP